MASRVGPTAIDNGAVDSELSAYRFTLLVRGDNELYRGERESADPILLVVPKAASAASRRRLEHELSLAPQINRSWAAKPLRLGRYDQRAALVLADPGGQPLDRLVGQLRDTGPFLRIAMALARAVAQVHERGLIHRDVKPANFLLDVDDGTAWLTGFGLASRLVRERQGPVPASVIAGTLAYMAPEQTGHMNRATDSRSDLYALGVTLYELLTGVLPFTISDPIELIHSHIARQPLAPSDHPHAADGQISRIVMKLLAKAAEDRYQTAAGLEADLARCLEGLEAAGRIEPFPLATRDAPDQLVIPERLYGRDAQIAALLAAFDRVTGHGAPEIVLVSGYSGIGKSSVVNELHKVIVLPRGIFITGKFDQRLRDIPFSTLAQAFQGLVRQILSGSDAEIAHWRDAIVEAVGANGRLLTDLVPDLVGIIGHQPAVPDLAAFDAQARLHALLQRFIGVFARPEHPLVIFIDDLQWLDPATLEHLEQIITNPRTRHVLLVCAYRNNEVEADHPLLRTMAAVRAAGVRIEELAVGPISPSDVQGLVRDALRCPAGKARELARIAYRKTGGNPFFTVQFLTSLSEQGLIRLDPGTKRWDWKLDDIEAQGFTDNLVDLMVGRLRRLPADTLGTLRLLACLGANADMATLERVAGATELEIHARLRAAVQAEMIVARAGNYRFLHDRVQEAAYALIPEASREALHQTIGHRLLAGLGDEAVEDQIFDIVNQLNLGVRPGGSDLDEMALVARLNLQAGLRAKASTAYASACRYLVVGQALLGEAGWTRSYDLTFKLRLERAHCELLRGALDASAELIDGLLQQAQSKIDRTAAFSLKITLQLLRGEMAATVRTALECLRMYDMTFPERPTPEEALRAYDEVKRRIGSRSIESLVDLPLMEDPEILALSTILLNLCTSSYFVDEQLHNVLACANVKLAIDHGPSAASAVGFGAMENVLGSAFGLFDEGVQFARTGVALCERHGFRVQLTEAQLMLQMALLWTRPIEEALQCLDIADQAAAETGEVVFACYSAEHRMTDLLARGDPLDLVWSLSAKAAAFVQERGYAHVIHTLGAIRQFIARLRGGSAGDAQLEHDEAALLSSGIPIVHCFYWTLQLQIKYLMGDPSGAFAAAEQAKPVLWSARCHIQAGTYAFYRALTLAAVIRATSAAGGEALRQELQEGLSSLARLAAVGPHTYAHKHLLVAAEVAGLEGRDLEAMRLYEQSMRSAADKGFIQEAALAAERAAEFFDDRGLDGVALTYRRQAREGYRRWGALAKVAQFDQAHPGSATAASQEPLPIIEAPLEHLDLAAVIRTSQAVSSEIVLDRLIETLMTIAIEHAGADRGLLVLWRGDDLRVAAEANSAGQHVSVALVGEDDPTPELPASILAQARRTNGPVLLNDAREMTEFATDRYLRQNRARSILCLPLVRQGEFMGALYLENHLASHVFTPARTAVLELLASQTAISLQNARLYADLVSENRERQRAEAAMREAQNEMARVARLTTVGELVASIAHEINQPLAAIVTNRQACSNWLGRSPPNLTEAQGALERIQNAVTRADDVMQSLRALVTKSASKRAWLAINEVIGEVVGLTQSELDKHGVTLVLRLGERLPEVLADRVLLQQVLLNFVINAAEAMSSVVDRPHTLTVTSGPALPTGVRVSVADSGMGLDGAAAERVFESFFTTKATGMGMGLSICRSIIAAHDGQIGAEANAPHGATFYFTLPTGSEPGYV